MNTIPSARWPYLLESAGMKAREHMKDYNFKVGMFMQRSTKAIIS